MERAWSRTCTGRPYSRSEGAGRGEEGEGRRGRGRKGRERGIKVRRQGEEREEEREDEREEGREMKRGR